MREEKDILRDATGTDQPKEESKIGKYMRIFLVLAFLALLAFIVIAGALNKYGA